MKKRHDSTRARSGNRNRQSRLAPGGNLRSSTRLSQAENLLEHGQAARAIEILAAVAPQSTSAAGANHQRLCRVLAFAHAQLGRLDEAERYAALGLAHCPESMDFPFILAFICARAGQFRRAAGYAEEYLRLGEEKRAADGRLTGSDRTNDLRYQVLNIYGVALMELWRLDEAAACLREVVTLRPDFDSPYVNLSLLYRWQGRYDDAATIIARGLQMTPDSPELRQAAESVARRATISACLIVKNEEKLLPRCLDSIRDLVDEIILVDTGSEDDTLDIARKYGCVIHHFPWQGDFSSARNESLQRATQDWILVIDADEEVRPEEAWKIRRYVSRPEAQVISISVYNQSPETGAVSSFLPSIRLFRRHLNLRYYGIVHNRLDVPPEVPVTRTDVRLLHYGYDLTPEQLEHKKERTMHLLEKQLAEDPNDVYANFNMAQLLRGFRDATGEAMSRRILDHAERVIGNPESATPQYVGQRLMALHQAAMALYNLKRFDQAEAYCRQALAAKPCYLDPLLTLGHIHFATDRLDEARVCYQTYLDARRTYRPENETDNIILLHLESAHVAWYALGLIAERQGKKEDAVDALTQALAFRQPYLDGHVRLGRLYLDLQDGARAEEMFRREIAANARSAFGWFGLGEALQAKGDYSGALEAFHQAVELMPENMAMRLTLGRVLLQAGGIDKGRTSLTATIDASGGDNRIRYEAANLLFAAGDLRPAADLYEQVLAAMPGHDDALNNLGNCYFKLQDFERARSVYEELINRAPTYTLAYRNLGLTYARLGQQPQALTVLLKYLENGQEDYPIFRAVATLYVAAGQEDRAIPYLEDYLRCHPGDHEALFCLAEVYHRLGLTDAAAAGYRHLLALAPGFQKARMRLDEMDALAPGLQLAAQSDD